MIEYDKHDSSRPDDNSSSIIFPTASEAYKILNELMDVCELFGRVSLAYFRFSCYVTYTEADKKVGWDMDSLAEAKVVRERENGGYKILLSMPKPIKPLPVDLGSPFSEELLLSQ